MPNGLLRCVAPRNDDLCHSVTKCSIDASGLAAAPRHRLSRGWVQAFDLDPFPAGTGDDQTRDFFALLHHFDVRTAGTVVERRHPQPVGGRWRRAESFFRDLNPAVKVMFHGGGFDSGSLKSRSLVVAADAGLAGAVPPPGGNVPATAVGGISSARWLFMEEAEGNPLIRLGLGSEARERTGVGVSGDPLDLRRRHGVVGQGSPGGIGAVGGKFPGAVVDFGIDDAARVWPSITTLNLLRSIIQARFCMRNWPHSVNSAVLSLKIGLVGWSKSVTRIPSLVTWMSIGLSARFSSRWSRR